MIEKTKPEIVDALSVDVEDYFQVEAFAPYISRSSWPNYAPRVRENTARVLELFALHNVSATFFVLGWVAEQFPTLVRQIAVAGHEIACHGYDHRRVTTFTRDEFRDDLRRARAAIEDACGIRVEGYRAPTFSITRENIWALEVLAEEGFTYDSSIFPIRHDNYGIADAPRFPHRRQLPNGNSIFEFPMSTVRIAGMNVPVGGGGYLRLLPIQFTNWAVSRIHQQDRQPVVVYFHPWEVDPDQPRLRGPWKSRFRHYTNLNKTLPRLHELLSYGHFAPMADAMARYEQGVHESHSQERSVANPVSSTSCQVIFPSTKTHLQKMNLIEE